MAILDPEPPLSDAELLRKLRWSINFPSRRIDADDNRALMAALEVAIHALSPEGGGVDIRCFNIEPTKRRDRCWLRAGHDDNCRAGSWASWKPSDSATHTIVQDDKVSQAKAWLAEHEPELTRLRALEEEAAQRRAIVAQSEAGTEWVSNGE